MKLVFLDVETIGEDIDFSQFKEFGEVIFYPRTNPDEVPLRLRDADIALVNKVPMNETTLKDVENLKLICVTATGTNNIDKDYLASRGIAWRNVAGYSTDSVTQHTFALLFYLLEKLPYYDNYVKSGRYANNHLFTHFAEPFFELKNKTWGIIGLGTIGRGVADIAKAFGCHVIYYSTSGQNQNPDYEQVSFDRLLADSDIISIHAPLTDATEGLINRAALKKMKKSAILINVGRGPIIVEQDLYDALEADEIAGAGLDVLHTEPMTKDNPLLKIKNSKKLIITPHIAWAAKEARERLMDLVVDQIRDYLKHT